MINIYSDSRCPLCGANDPVLYFEDKNRIYLSCPDCFLVFVPDAYFLTKEAEKHEYDLHSNDPSDPGYRRFLSRLSNPMLERLSPGQIGLDFGCGPGPALHLLFKEHGHTMDLFDPFYRNDTDLLSDTYDFITVTEVVEHLHQPARGFEKLFSLMRCGGWLGIMTKLVRDKASFSNWHYIRDLTHVCFYSRTTFSYIAGKYNASLEFVGDDVMLMQKENPKAKIWV